MRALGKRPAAGSVTHNLVLWHLLHFGPGLDPATRWAIGPDISGDVDDHVIQFKAVVPVRVGMGPVRGGYLVGLGRKEIQHAHQLGVLEAVQAIEANLNVWLIEAGPDIQIVDTQVQALKCLRVIHADFHPLGFQGLGLADQLVAVSAGFAGGIVDRLDQGVGLAFHFSILSELYWIG